MEQKRGYTAIRELTIAQQPADDRPEEESERTAEEHPAEGRQEHRLEDTGHAVGRTPAARRRGPLEPGHGPEHSDDGAGQAAEAKEECAEQRTTLSRRPSHHGLHRLERALPRRGGR